MSQGFHPDQNPFKSHSPRGSGWGTHGPVVGFRHNWKAHALMFDGSVQALGAPDTVGRAGTVIVPAPSGTRLSGVKRGWLRGFHSTGYIEHVYGTWFDAGGWE
jgi:hypothetical protein